MNLNPVKIQIHKYRNGHQLVASSIDLSRSDQDIIDRLSDISGQPYPGQIFAPYFTCYPLPSTKYFVVARTWQDVNAPRAGCVITKSLVIPLEEWKNTDHVMVLFSFLKNSFPEDESLLIEFEELTVSPPTINGSTEELSEAIFLEQRKPIIVFNCDETDSILVRLYSAFWPTLKSNFSSCSLALSPRQINGRPMDLQFASSSNRNKFADWAGRKIEYSFASYATRHRWTNDLVSNIFKSSRPTISANASEFHFALHSPIANENTFRTLLLWSELIQKIYSTPLSLLGLLDIINANQAIANDLFLRLQPLLKQTIVTAPQKFSINEAWQFYNALLGKYHKKYMSVDLLKLIKEACIKLAEINPIQSIDFFENYNNSNQKIPSMLFTSLGNGISKFEDASKLFELFDLMSPYLTSQLLVHSKQFAKSTVTELDFSIPSHIEKLHAILVASQYEQRKHLIKNLSSFIHEQKDVPLVDFLFSVCTAEEYHVIVTRITINTHLSSNFFNETIIQSAIKLKEEYFLLSVLEQYGIDEIGIEIYLELLQRNINLMSWLCFESKLDLHSRYIITTSVFQSSEQLTIQFVSRHTEILKAIISLLSLDSQTNTTLIAKLLFASNLPIDETLKELKNLSLNSFNFVSPTTYNLLLSRALSEANYQHYEYISYLLQFDKLVDFRQLISTSIFRKTPERIINNLSVLLSNPSTLPRFVPDVDLISQVIFDNAPNFISNQLQQSWATLIMLSQNNLSGYRRSASIMLQYAYRFPKQDSTKLIITAFPIVYNTYANGVSIPWYAIFDLFNDWDKCKTLRQDLVHRYFNSYWQGFTLFQTAEVIGIMDEVIHEIRKYKSGKKFIMKAINTLRGFTDNNSRRAFSRLAKLFN